MSVLLALESSLAAAAISQYAAIHGLVMDVTNDLDEAIRRSRFRCYTTIICDASFSGPFRTDGLDIVRTAKRVRSETRTIVLATSVTTAIESAHAFGDVDVVLLKPQPLAKLLSNVVGAADPFSQQDEDSSCIVVDLAEHRRQRAHVASSDEPVPRHRDR